MKKYFNIDIPKRHLQCSHAREELTPGNAVYSAIFEEEHSFSRKDYCSHCWTQLQKNAALQGTITHWKSVIPEKEETKDFFLDRDEKALELLKQFAMSKHVKELQQAMILALYLTRKRKLYQRKEITNKEGELEILFEVAQSQEILSVKKIDVEAIDLPKVQKAIAAHLKECQPLKRSSNSQKKRQKVLGQNIAQAPLTV